MILTFDIEEWWSVESFKEYIEKPQKAKYDDRIEIGINVILESLKKYNAKGTFFFLGRVAEKNPEIVEKVINHGHDIGTHGYDHTVIYKQTPQEFEKDLQKSIKTLNNITQNNIDKYRAPSYTIRKDTLWALKVLHINGIKYDSSMYNGNVERFGVKNIPAEPFKVMLDKNATMIEFPVNSINIFNKQLPITSGFAFRLFPEILIKNFVKTREYNMLVLHNWEFDSRQPRLHTSLKSKLIHYYNLEKTLSRFKRLLVYSERPQSLRQFVENEKNEKQISVINLEKFY